MVSDPGFLSALAPHLPPGEGTERLQDELTDFLVRLGAPVEERAGRRIACLPMDRFGPELGWAFVADHLITQVSLPVRRLEEMTRLLSRALENAAADGSFDQGLVRATVRSIRAATKELRRLDTLSRGLRALPEAGRPGRDLYERDPAAYAAAMWRWENEQPAALEELEGGFLVVFVDDTSLELRHFHREDPLFLQLPPALVALCRAGDRIDALFGRGRSGWFVMDAFAVAAPKLAARPDVGMAPGAP